MSRSKSVALALALVTVSGAAAQQSAPRVVGPGAPGPQPQVGAGAYQGAIPAARGVNPFAGPVVFPTIPPGPRLAARNGGAPVVFAPPPPPVGVPNNPAAFNLGVQPPFPVLIPPPLPAAYGVSYNPLFVSRRGVVSAYYVPPTGVRSPGVTPYPSIDEFLPEAPENGSGLVPPPGEYRFLPWIW